MLAVTNTKAFNIIDEKSRTLWTVDECSSVYYGITFTQNRLYVAARQAVYGTAREIQNNVILCFNERLELEETLKPDTPLRDIHQITIVDDILYACSTFDDQIGCYDTRTRTWDFWRPFGQGTLPGQDVHHINSITVTEDAILLSGTREAGWVARFDKETRRPIGGKRFIGEATHNVWLDNGVLHVCSADEGGIRNEAGVLYKIAEQSWARGYCSDGGRRYVGLSEIHIRKDRENSDSYLVECDKNFNIIQSFHIEGTGMIHDLRTLDTPDPSHNMATFAIDRSVLDEKFRKTRLENSLGRFTANGHDGAVGKSMPGRR